MKKMNKRMQDLVAKLGLRTVRLNSKLDDLTSNGFIEQDGCYFLKALCNRDTNVDANSFPDKTGYECFVNSVHIDDYVKKDYLQQAMVFIDGIFTRWLSENVHVLVAIVAVNEFGVNAKFHVRRNGEQWLHDDIESYKEPVLVLDTSKEEQNP